MLDTDTEQRDNQSQRGRFGEANHAYYALWDELGNLSEDEITERNAPFIAGLLIGRHLEQGFLDWETTIPNNPGEIFRKEYASGREWIAKYHKILQEAQKGNFLGLKEFVKEEVADIAKDSAEDFEEGDPDRERRLRNGRNAALLAEKIPLKGDGSAIKMPNPVNIENPVPLKNQLERFAAGGEIR